MKTIKDQLLDLLLIADKNSIFSLIDENINTVSNLEFIITQIQDDISKLWDDELISLAQIYMSGSITEELISKYWGNKSDSDKTAKVGFAVLSDYHSLGMKIVSSHLNSHKLNHYILGIGLEPDQVVDMIQDSKIEILLISTLMMPSAYRVKELKNKMQLNKMGHIPIVVGGAPFRLDPELWKEVGADGCGKDAVSTYKIVKKYFEEGRLD